MKDKLYNYTIATLDLLAPELTVEEKEALVIKIVSENFPKCAAEYLKKDEPKNKLEWKPLTKEDINSEPFKPVLPAIGQPYTLPKDFPNPLEIRYTNDWAPEAYDKSLENYQAS